MTTPSHNIPALADAIDPRRYGHGDKDRMTVPCDELIAASDALRSLTTAVEIGRARSDPFNYATYTASLPPELRAYVPRWGPINGVPIEDVARMLRERDDRIRELEDAMSKGDTL